MAFELFIVGVGGFVGAIARYLVYLIERSIGPAAFPFGTLIINLVGCLLAGLLLGVIERVVPMQRHLALFCSMGIIGSFTTFSTFSVESFQLLQANQTVLAMLSVGANVILGICSVGVGKMLIAGF